MAEECQGIALLHVFPTCPSLGETWGSFHPSKKKKKKKKKQTRYPPTHWSRNFWEGDGGSCVRIRQAYISSASARGRR